MFSFNYQQKPLPLWNFPARVKSNNLDFHYHDSYFFFYSFLTNLGKSIPQPNGQGDGLFLQLFSCSSRANLFIPKLQYWQGSVWCLQCALWASKSLRMNFLRQPLGQTTTQYSHVLWCTSFSSCWPSQVQPTFKHLIFTLLIMPRTMKLVCSSRATKGIEQVEQTHCEFLCICASISVFMQDLQTLWPHSGETGLFISSLLQSSNRTTF